MPRLWFLVTFLGFMVNFLLAMGVDQFFACPVRWRLTVFAGLIGGLHAGCSLLPGFSFLGQTLWRVVFLLLSAMAAFWENGKRLRRTALFLLLHFSVGAFAGGQWWLLTLVAALIYLLCKKGMGEQKKQFAHVTIVHQGQTVDLTALLDTGNTLTDPVSGKSVLVVDGAFAQPLLGLEYAALGAPLETFTDHFTPNLRLIPYTSVGQPGGMLLGLRADAVYVDGRLQPLMIAFAPHKIGQGKSFQALAGGSL